MIIIKKIRVCSAYKVLSIASHIVFFLAFAGVLSAVVSFPLALAFDAAFHVSDRVALDLFLVFCAPAICASFYLCRSLYRRGQAITQNARKDWFGSLVLWGTPAILLMMLSLYLAWHFESALLTIPFFAAPLAAFLLAVLRPFKTYNGFSLAVHAISFGAMAFVFLLFGFTMARMGKPIEYAGNDPSEIPRLTPRQVKMYFPENASSIVIHGDTMCFEWECNTSEKDFERFALQWDFRWRTAAEEPGLNEACYLYNARRGDGGGVTMRYLPQKRKLYGQYSHH